MKKCSKCGRLLDETMFNKNRTSKDGLQSWCKDCKAEYASLHKKNQEISLFNFKSIPVPVDERLFEVKVCKRCGQELPLSHFWKNRKSKDGLQNWCKACQTQYAQERINFINESKNEKAEKEKLIFVDKPTFPTFSFWNWTDVLRKYINGIKELSIPLNKLESLNIINGEIKIKYKK